MLPPLRDDELVPVPVDDPDDASKPEASKPTALPFDSLRFAGPVVRRFARQDGHDGTEDEEWRMYYYGRALDFHDHSVCSLPTGSVGMATSRDGVHWERKRGIERGGALLAPNCDNWWWFDTQHVAVSDVQWIESERIRTGNDGVVCCMFTFGGDNECVPPPSPPQQRRESTPEQPGVRGFRTRPGIALSLDGLHWSRLEGEHSNGAVLDTGAAGEFDELFCGWPVVARRPSDGLFLMYYHTLDMTRDGRFVVGLATSRDALHWRKREPREPVLLGSETGSGAFDERGIGTRCVLALSPRQREHVAQWPTAPPGVQLVMFAEGVDADGAHSIGVYASADGVEWRALREDGKPILAPSGRGSGRWDALAVGTPSAVIVDEDLTVRLYYVGFEEAPAAATTPPPPQQRRRDDGNDRRQGGGPSPRFISRSCIGLAVSDGPDWRKPFRRWTTPTPTADGRAAHTPPADNQS